MGSSIDYAQEYQQAQMAYMQQDYETAASVIDRLVQDFPDDPSARLLRGHIYCYGLQQYQVAQEEYSAVLGLTSEPDFIDYANSGLAYAEQFAGSGDAGAAAFDASEFNLAAEGDIDAYGPDAYGAPDTSSLEEAYGADIAATPDNAFAQEDNAFGADSFGAESWQSFEDEHLDENLLGDASDFNFDDFGGSAAAVDDPFGTLADEGAIAGSAPEPPFDNPFGLDADLGTDEADTFAEASNPFALDDAFGTDEAAASPEDLFADGADFGAQEADYGAIAAESPFGTPSTDTPGVSNYSDAYNPEAGSYDDAFDPGDFGLGTDGSTDDWANEGSTFEDQGNLASPDYGYGQTEDETFFMGESEADAAGMGSPPYGGFQPTYDQDEQTFIAPPQPGDEAESFADYDAFDDNAFNDNAFDTFDDDAAYRSSNGGAPVLSAMDSFDSLGSQSNVENLTT
jgi:twitching motility protein PilJ